MSSKSPNLPKGKKMDREQTNMFFPFFPCQPQEIPAGSSVLVAWEHKVIGQLAGRLDSTGLAPAHYPKHGWEWCVVFWCFFFGSWLLEVFFGSVFWQFFGVFFCVFVFVVNLLLAVGIFF